MTDIFSGDLKLYITPDGASVAYLGGQPIMETGKANIALISLFTRRGWCGNLFARSTEETIGSDFEEALNTPVTLKSLNYIRDAAEKALLAGGFKQATAVVTNPISNRIRVEISIVDDIGQEYVLRMETLRPGTVNYLTFDGINILTFDGENELAFRR